MDIKIGEIIRNEMKRQGMGHSQLAEKICTSRTNVYNIIKRDSICTEQLMRINRVLNKNFFALFADELNREGIMEPTTEDSKRELWLALTDEERPYFRGRDIAEGYQLIKVLDVDMNINGVDFFASIELPQDIFPLLDYAYGCAIDGELRELIDDELDEAFYAWLERNHPKLARVIAEYAEDQLTEWIAEDIEGTYREVLNYEAPTDVADGYCLGDNDIRYYMGDLEHRIREVKRPQTWLTATLEL